MKDAGFWDVTPCDVYKNRVSEKRIATIIRATKICELLRSVLRFLVAANVPNSPILVPLMMEMICSSDTSVLTRSTRCHIPEDGIP
jgi:hypothetical protein